MVSVGTVERNVLARRQVCVPVVLIARGAEPGSAKCAFGHTCCLPGGWRSLSATLDTRTRFPSRAKSNHVSAVFPHLSCVLPAKKTACTRSRGDPRVPLAAPRQDVAPQHHVVPYPHR